MPRILQLGESRAISKSSSADFTCAVDSGIELGPESSITLERALVHKPGADLEQTAGSITVESDQTFQITAFVGIETINDGQSGGTEKPLDGLAPKVYDFKKYYVCQSNIAKTELFIEPLFIPITIPAGTYRPSNLASLISAQTRTPVSFEDVPAGTIRTPSILLAKDHSQSPTIRYGCTEFKNNTLTLAPVYPRPIPSSITGNLPNGANVSIYYNDVDRGWLTRPAVIQSVAADGLVTISGIDFGSGETVTVGYIDTTGGATAHDYYLRLNEGDATGEMKPTGDPGLSREAFGSTTGISFQWDDVSGRFSMNAHSPLYNQGAVSVLCGLKEPTGEPAWGGIGPRGFLAFGTDSWGFTEDNWETSPFWKMGFKYSDLNGTTSRDDSSGWLSTSAYIDGSFDIAQSADPPVTLPVYFQSARSNGPQGQVLSLAPGVLSTPLWLIQVSIMPASEENRWISADGSDCSGVVGTCTKQYASGDFFTSEGGPVWTLAKNQKPFIVGSVRVRILNGLTMVPDETVGEGSTIILEIS